MQETNQSETVLVVGSTGYLGSEICRQLVAAGKTVKGLIRPTSAPAKVDALHQMGVKTVVGDIKLPETLDTAFQNVGVVISTATATISRQTGDSIETVDEAGQLNVVQAAKKAGVKHFVFISVVPMLEDSPLQQAKRKVEAGIVTSGLTYTILQPATFMEIWLNPAMSFDFPNNKAIIYGDGNSQISWISLYDVAAFAVAALDNVHARNQVLKLGGPEVLTPLEVVRIFEESSGKTFSLQHIPKESLQAQKQVAEDSLSRSFAAFMLEHTNGCKIDMQEVLQKIPLTLHSVKEYARRVTQVKHKEQAALD